MTLRSLRYVRHGRGSVRPYLRGPAGLPQFLVSVFDAIELEKHEFGPNSFPVELAIGDSVVVVEAGELPPDVNPWMGSVYVYVENADAVHARALSLGAKSISVRQDKPYRKRQGGFSDAAGNTWWVSTYRDN